jgi:uncharacterized damage-inducible protein DinB
MTVRDLERLFDYSAWANAKLLQVVSQLTPEQFTQTVAGSYGSIRNTLVHMVSAEWGWIDRCGGPARGAAALEPDNYPDVATLIATLRAVEAHGRAFLATLQDEDLARVVQFTLPGRETHAMLLGGLLQHAATHGVHHRGQVALLLRMLGYVPGNVDILLYDVEQRSAI